MTPSGLNDAIRWTSELLFLGASKREKKRKKKRKKNTQTERKESLNPSPVL